MQVHNLSAAAAAKLLQSCLTLCNPMDCSLPGSSIHGVFQARVLEYVAIAFSDTTSQGPETSVGSLILIKILNACDGGEK